ncbi:Ig-like domain-containing protein [Curtobacterium sp. MCBA15_009]|uniref:Ig-like domain-containing protein n=1 Tax=Curtobacterium sp. MCBA15_009 TaxID=1898737 RepID=UPI0011135464|nr:Ig-like domain-containing protein [Curtobacterium sp. MCBA15_009]
MSHKKRASTAFKSMGAAGLAAATIVSGLSFGLPAASAAADPISTSSMTSPLVFKVGSSYRAYTIQPEQWGESRFKVTNHSSYSSASAAATPVSMPDPGQRGVISVEGKCLGAHGFGSFTLVSAEARYCSGDSQSNWRVSTSGSLYLDFGDWKGYAGAQQSYEGAVFGSISGTSYDLGGPRFDTSPLVASLTKTNNIARTAVIGGTATPNGTVTIGSKTVNVSNGGTWSMTVDGLSVGTQTLTAKQRFNNADVDEKPVTVTIVEGGTVVGVNQGPVELTRGASTEVPFLVQNNETRTNMKGSVTLTAPAGTTFADGQATVAASYRSGTSGDFRPYTRLDLKNGVRSDGNTKITFDLDTAGGNMVAGEQYQYMLNVTTPADAAAGSGQMGFTYAGDSSKGDYRAEGKTTTNLEVAQRELTAAVDSIDHAAGSAVLKGTATPGATIVIGEQSATANEDGDWSLEVTGLESGPNSLLVEQKIGNDTVDSKPVTVTINDAAIIGQDGPAATLERGERTKVQAQFETKGDVSRPDAQVTFTAPEGTTFAEGQNTIEGSYKKPGEDWANRSATLTGGEQSMDGKTYTYTFKPTSSTWTLPDASLLRWDIDVVTPVDAAEGTSSMTTKLEGTAVQGSFNASSSTRTTIESAEAPAPAPLVVTTPANDSVVDVKRPMFSGTGDEGATIEVRGKSGRLVATTTVQDGAWSVPASFDLNDNAYALDVFQKPLQGKESQTEVRFTIATNPLTTQLTADGRFLADVTKLAEIFGNATTGATVTVKDSLGNPVGEAEAVDGKYVIPVPPSLAHFGVNEFTVTQTKNDVTSDEEDVSLDYGTPAPIQIASPQNGDTVAKEGLTFTGTGDDGARIDVRGNVRAIATGTVTDGTWTAPVTLDLQNDVYDLRAIQTTKGGLTTQQPITITITDRTDRGPDGDGGVQRHG